MSSHDGIPLAEPFTEERTCPGCNKSVVYDGGMVVAFGQSFFHVDCFKCAKCNNKVTADTNLLLLSDGSPVCADCSYSCNVCGLPILDEAIMTGNESYHAHCFNCKVCQKRIEELVFAKTTQGIYCMDCHNARVARSKKHQERREREKREREKRAADANAIASSEAAARTSVAPVRSMTNGHSQPTSNEAQSSQHNARSDARTNGQTSIPQSSQYATAPAPATLSRGPSSSSTLDGRTPNPHSPVRHGSSVLSPEGASPPANGSSSKRYSIMYGRPESPRGTLAFDSLRSSTTSVANMDTLVIPSDGMSKSMQKRKSFDDRPLNILLKDVPESIETYAPRQDSLLAPQIGSSRKDKRRSINPAIAMALNNATHKPQSSSPVSSPTTPNQPHSNNPLSPPNQGHDHSGVSSPLRDQFPLEITASPPSFAENGNSQLLFNPTHLNLDTSSTTEKQVTGRSRSASSSAYPDHSYRQASGLYERQRSRSPIHPNFTLDRLPTRTSSRTDNRQETAPPSFTSDTGRGTPQLSTEGRMSPSLNVLNSNHVHRQRSFEHTSRFSTSSLGQTIELPPLRKGSRPTSPAHKVDVPRGVESETDTEVEGEEEFVSLNEQESLPPLPPPKEGRGAKIRARPPQLTLDTSSVDDKENTDFTQLDSEDLEDFSHDEPVETTSHATFIAPALPPIRFSLGGADFAELLKSVGGLQESGKALDQIIEGMEQEVRKANASSPTMATPTIDGARRYQSIDSTPARSHPNESVSLDPEDEDLTVRRNPVARKRNRSPSPGPLTDSRKQSIDAAADSFAGFSRPTAEANFERSRSFSDTRDFRPPFDRGRSRGDSNASIVPTGITVTSPDNATSKVLRPDTADLVRSRLQEALFDSNGRGSSHVKLDMELVGAILSLLDQHKEEYDDMKRGLDGMKRASQQYVDGLSVAQTEYDRELKARRDAEAEVTRLRVLLSGQAVRLTAALGETKRQEAQKQLSQELSESLSSLEKELAKLQVERDMTLAEVEELSASKSSPVHSSDADAAGTLGRALSMRFDTIKNQYQHVLLPLTSQKETLLREITELKASRDAFLEEATILNARNEELAQLSAQYVRRIDAGRPETSVNFDKRGDSLDKVRPNLSSSVMSSTVLHSEGTDDIFIKISKPDPSEPPAHHPVKTTKFKWPGSRSHAPKDIPASHDANKTKRREHTFQQISMLLSRCDHCGDKMWGSQLRCSSCSIAVHTRCVHQVAGSCTQQSSQRRDEQPAAAPVGPSLFGRDLAEQIKADSKDEPRTIPVIVEKCISAVDALALDYEGIYRKSGGSGQTKMITQLFERGDYVSFDLLDTDRFNDICSVTSVLKTYFRSLPNPLLTYALHEKFIGATAIKDPEEKAKVMTSLVSELPKEHYHTTRALMLHLHRICEKSGRNLMHARNLGVVFGPTLMRSQDPNAEFADMAGKALFVEWLVENATAVFASENLAETS